jgi:DNA-binding NtrC family response regulator
LVEDEMLIGLAFADTLERAGYTVQGPYPNADVALAAIEADPPSAAVLDVNLGQQKTSEPVAQALAARKVPFLFVTGYSKVRSVVERFPDIEHLSKPLSEEDLLRAVETLGTRG